MFPSGVILKTLDVDDSLLLKIRASYYSQDRFWEPVVPVVCLFD